ncbi:type III-B CRISPR module-associated Cmr3 family protein [Oceanithermus sp.]
MILLIQPRDPLIVRDGRPFSAFPGAKVRGYSFPPPQVIAGAIRSRVGLACGYRKEDRDKWQNLLSSIRIEGPLLLDKTDEKVLFPAPLDALLIKTDAGKEVPCENENPPQQQSKNGQAGYRLYRLKPEPVTEGAQTNLPAGLQPVFAPEGMPKAKPAPMPPFWRPERFFSWLLGTDPKEGLELKEPGELGIAGPATETRTHVKIEAATQTAEESMLFETSSLEFIYAKEPQNTQEGSSPPGNTTRLALLHELALLVRVSSSQNGCPQAAEVLSGIHPLGGERRLALWEEGGDGLWPPKANREEIFEAIQNNKRARVILLTPADFNSEANEKPYLPLAGFFGGARIEAASIGRPLTVSGWDMLAGKPKPSRRLVPAGSVYFVDLSEVQDIETWLEEHWMKVLPEQPEQSKRDGYGLAVVGVWR